MKDLSEEKQKLIKDLVKNKKFHQLEFEVNSLLLEKRSPFLLNLLGVSKISKVPTSKKDLNESLDLFKEAYLKDRTLIDALFNYAEISIRLLKYGEAKDRPIYGEATIEQTKELIDEEINVEPLPFAPKRKTN